MMKNTNVLAALFLATACASPAPKGTEAPTQTDTPPVTQVITAAEVEGYWTGDWGKLMLRSVGDEVRATYLHDEGTVTGRMSEEGVVVGWWCEAPSREAPKDAGQVEFRFVDTDGQLALDGRWRYASEGEWREDWDLVRVNEQPPEELVARFNDEAAFCRQ
jgi:hypothetical protein